ncbi:hypothetical protein APSETT444_002442 [Aspergillus pseudonomiae]
MTMFIGVLTAVPWIVVMATVITDLEAVQTAFLPSMEIFYQATGNKVAATILQAYLTLLYYKHDPANRSSMRAQPVDRLQSNSMGIFTRRKYLNHRSERQGTKLTGS